MKNAKNIRGLQSIGQIIPVTLKKFDTGSNMSKYMVIINWEKIVGREIAGNAFVSNIDRGKLIVKVKNSVWSHHLMMLKEEIMQKINRYLGKNLITDIWFMAGYDKDNQNYKSSETVLDEKLIIPMRLDESEMAAVRLIAGNISDDKMRNKVISLLVKDMGLEKAKKFNNWHSCLNCKILVPPEEKYCTVCRINKNEINAEKNNTSTIEKLLLKNPWLSYNEVERYITSSVEEYNAAKKNLVRYYFKKIFSKDENGGKNFQADLVMLLKEIRPENLTQVCIDEVIFEIKNRLLKTRGEKYVSASGS